MSTKRLLPLLALVACASSVPSFAAIAVTNGSFQVNTANGACASGWTCVNGGNFGEEPVSFWNGQLSGSNLATSPDGGNVLATWDIDSGNAIMQTLTGLTIGDNYSLSFYEAASDRNSQAGNTNGTVGWQVSVGNTLLGTSSVAIPGAQSATPWSSFSYNFVATATNEVLKFLSVSSVAVAPEPLLMLDGVKIQPTVAAVPEPSTWAMMGAGFGAIAFITRRRQRNASNA